MIQIGAAGFGVRPERPDLQQQLGGERIAARADFRAFFGVLLIGKSGRFARAGLNIISCPSLMSVGSKLGVRPRGVCREKFL